MLSFFRRLIHSKAGLVITFGVLAVIALAFAAGDVTGLGHGGGSVTGDNVASVGNEKIGAAELRERTQRELDSFRQQQPGLDMVQFVTQGGLDGTLERVINQVALQEFGQDQGMVVSKAAVDAQIAAIPAFQGPDGKFSPTAYQRLLAERRLTDAGIRSDITRDIMAQQIVAPQIGASQVARAVALPYASLLLEKRQGSIAFVPDSAGDTGPAPTEAEVAAFYNRNRARYMVPERRVVRYALVTPAAIKDKAVPTEAEIAAAYKAQAARYAGGEKRTVSQVIVADQKAAQALVAKVKGGMPIADAARAAGLEPATLTVDKAGLAAQSSTEIANAAFGATQGSVLGPLKAPLGFAVLRVDAITQEKGRPLAEARAEIVPALTQQKTQAALVAVQDALNEAIGNNATFAELVSDQKLTAQTTPALAANGSDPENAAFKPAPEILPVLSAAFQAEQGDDPQLVQTAQDGSFAVVALDRVVPAAPRPLAQVRDTVTRDFRLERAHVAARKIAAAVLSAAQKGTPLEQAVRAADSNLPAVKPLRASRAQLFANRAGAPPALTLLFSMVQGSVRVIEAPQQGGWMVVKLEQVQKADAKNSPGVIAAVRQDLARSAGREYVQQLTRAIRNEVGVKKNDGVIASVRAQLLGQENGQP
ncbi:peptidylprolyl isomerase [Sphingomonas aracearum]|uniref:Parvulin-like PPIase n=1 Tax=Sphingomonas aracearum TaxID=2283317 RepID=A0A369VVJ6_9SPHN|nr:peptidylprolyl isomerase [Sphingomonas aracearum]RDE06368.1 peptidylprolyl isomerase [Sphingomonas aracearum]